MFFFKKKTKEPVDLSWLGADMHSHLIPGIDDGAPDMETSLELIRGLAALGYKKVITTPHILWEVYPNTAEIITNGLQELRQAIAAEGINIQVHAAAEYFMDDHFERLLKDKVPLLTLKDNLVLVEFSMITAPFDLQQVMFELQLQGYQPIVAHPERYIYLNRKRAFFEELKNYGCYFQLNLLSITGYYGTSVQELAEYLLAGGFYDFAGTDMHHGKHLATLQKLSTYPLYNKLKDRPWKNSVLL